MPKQKKTNTEMALELFVLIVHLAFIFLCLYWNYKGGKLMGAEEWKEKLNLAPYDLF